MKSSVVSVLFAIILLSLWIISSCQPNTNHTPTYGNPVESTPTTIPEDGIWVHFKIYTINDITPYSTTIKMIIISPSGDSSEVLLNKITTDISGVSLYTGWVMFGNLSETNWDHTYYFKFYNSEGKKALGLYMTDAPRWRYVNKYTGNLYRINAEKKLYEYKEIIRHWKDSPMPDKKYTIKLNFVDEDGNKVKAAGKIYVRHMGDSEIIYGWNEETETLSFVADKIRLIKDEEKLPLNDRLEFFMRSDFYNHEWELLNYSDLKESNELNITLYANRITTFKWAISDNGIFNGNEETAQSTINTISNYDFVNEDVGWRLWKSIKDSHRYDLNGYDFDDDGKPDLRSWWSSEKKVMFSGYYGRIADLGELNLSDVKDLTGYSYVYLVDANVNHVYAVKTSGGKYVKFKVIDIHKMSREEMDPHLYEPLLEPLATTTDMITSDSTPSDVPEDGIWVRFDIYTIDDITPPGELKMVITYPDGTNTAIVTLSEKSSNIPGLSFYTKWVRFDNLSETDWWHEYHFEFYNSNGVRALGVYRISRPFWRSVNGLCLCHVRRIDYNKKQYSYSELIRHWEDSPMPDKSYSFKLRYFNEDGKQIKALGRVFVGHSGSARSVLWQTSENSEFNFITNRIRLIDNEEMLPFKDHLNFLINSDFYNEEWEKVYYTDLKETNDLNITLYANRMTTFKWAVSDDGNFNDDEETVQSTINTVSIYSFVHRYVGYAFLASFKDLKLTDLDEYDFDGDNKTDLWCWWSNYNKKVEFNSGHGIVDLGEMDLSDATDLRKYSYGYWIYADVNHVYAVKTSGGKYVKFKVTDIHVMDKSEMEKWMLSAPPNEIESVDTNLGLYTIEKENERIIIIRGKNALDVQRKSW